MPSVPLHKRLDIEIIETNPVGKIVATLGLLPHLALTWRRHPVSLRRPASPSPSHISAAQTCPIPLAPPARI